MLASSRQKSCLGLNASFRVSSTLLTYLAQQSREFSFDVTKRPQGVDNLGQGCEGLAYGDNAGDCAHGLHANDKRL